MTRFGFSTILVPLMAAALVCTPVVAQNGARKPISPHDHIQWLTPPGITPGSPQDYCQRTASVPGHPGPQFRPTSPTVVPPNSSNDNCLKLSPGQQCTRNETTYLNTSTTCWPQPETDPFTLPPGTNLLPNVYTNMQDGSGNIMPNTLPSTPTIPYNLHDGDPKVTKLDNAISPLDDLKTILDELQDHLASGDPQEPDGVVQNIEFAIAILQGDRLSDFVSEPRAYEYFPVLHYTGPNKLKTVDPTTNTVHVRQIWYDEHIESDTAMIDVSNVLEEPWIVEYTIDVLSRGEDDFSPFAIYTDDPALQDPDWTTHLPGRGRPDHVGMDQTFFPMQEGTRTVLRVKMTPGKYLNLIYTWGWRMHPPRIQSAENALKSFPPAPSPLAPPSTNPCPSPYNTKPCLLDTANQPVPQQTLHDWETSVFGTNPTASQDAKRTAIGMIGDLSPAKRMWTSFNRALEAAKAESPNWSTVLTQVQNANAAFFDWRTRSRLPAGVEIDPDADLTLLYVNNTIYGEFTNEISLRYPQVRWPEWSLRGDSQLKVTLYNGDYFQHAYVNVDFGGSRGWENQFKSSVKVGGSGCWFTFGRAHWLQNNKPVVLAAAQKPGSPTDTYTPTMHKMNITYNFEPSTRLRFYQFDPMHHDVAIFSVH